MGEGGPALPGAVHPDAQVEAIGRLPGEGLTGLGAQPVGDGGGQGPGKDRQPGGYGGQDGRAGGRLVIWVTGDAGVVEDEQAVWLGLAAARWVLACRSSASRSVSRSAWFWFSVDASPWV